MVNEINNLIVEEMKNLRDYVCEELAALDYLTEDDFNGWVKEMPPKIEALVNYRYCHLYMQTQHSFQNEFCSNIANELKQIAEDYRVDGPFCFKEAGRILDNLAEEFERKSKK